MSTEYLETKLTKVLAPSSPASEAKALGDIVKALESAKAPIIVVDGGAARHQWTDFVDDFIEALKIPFFVSVLGKGAANEQSPYYAGPYGGVGSLPNAIKAVSEADVILWLGNYPSDFNTYAFSLNPGPNTYADHRRGMFTEHVENSLVIDFQRFEVKVRDAELHPPKRTNHPTNI